MIVDSRLRGAVIVVDWTIYVAVSFAADLSSVFLDDVTMIDKSPLWLPEQFLQQEALVAHCIAKRQIFRLYVKGLVSVHAKDSGKCISVVDIGTYAALGLLDMPNRQMVRIRHTIVCIYVLTYEEYHVEMHALSNGSPVSASLLLTAQQLGACGHLCKACFL